MQISCLINNYNYSQFLSETLDSVLFQEEKFDEIIVVDDGSTDNSLEILKSYQLNYPEIKIISQKNQGQLACFNTAFLYSKGDLLCFLDSDDKLKSNYVVELKKFYAKYEDCDFAFCAYELFGENQISKNVFSYNNQRLSFGKTQLFTLATSYPWINGIKLS